MTCRPVDENGDILPVRKTEDLFSGEAAMAAGLRDHLHLLYGDWWEYEEKGNEILEMIAISRRTERDADALSAYLASYILAFPGIRTVSEVQAAFEGRAFRFSCVAQTEGGERFPLQFEGN